MTRSLYPGNLVLLASGAPAPSLPFTVWDSRTGGTDVTASLTAPDGVTTYVATTDSIGQQLPFRGPDGWRKSLWLDSGVTQRYRMESSEVADSDVDDQQTLDSRVTALEGGGGSLNTAAVQAIVLAMLAAGSGVSLAYDGTAHTITISSTATISLANVPPGFQVSIPYATAYAASTRAAAIAAFMGSSVGSARTDILVRVWGGLDSDPTPTWLTGSNGDTWELVPVGG